VPPANTDEAAGDRCDVMRRWCDYWNQGDLDAFIDLYDADAEVITDPSWVEAGPFRGRAAIRDWFAGLRESWDGRTVAALSEVFVVGEHVVTRLSWQVRGRTSGIDTELDVTSVNTIREGRIVRQQHYFDHAAALDAVGLSE
jgi:ketosteroid isomerase-like protein